MNPFTCIVCLLVLNLVGCSSPKNENTETDPAKIRITKRTAKEVLSAYANQHADSLVRIETSYGTIKLRLYTGTPLHRASFVRLIHKGYFDSADFYRIVPNMVIQGGRADKRGMGLENYEIPHEISPRWFHKRGALAMAHQDESKGSSPYDFYIVQGTVLTGDSVRAVNRDTGYPLMPEQEQAYTTIGGVPHLDYRYTVFGEVIEGMNIVDSIARAYLAPNTERPQKQIPLKISLQE